MKNIFKILGLSALVCLGGFTLVGCSALDNKDEIAKLTETIEILEENNKLLEETNENLLNQNSVLSDQNDKLTDLNNSLTEQNNILNQELSKLTNEDAVRILKETGSKYLFNKDNVLNNLKLTSLNNGQDSEFYEIYYNDDTNGPIYYQYQMLGDGDYVTLIYEEEKGFKTAIVQYINPLQLEIKSKEIKIETTFYEILLENTALQMVALDMLDSSKESVHSIQADADGNYIIKFSNQSNVDEYGYYSIYNYEIKIDNDLRILEVNANAILMKDQYDYENDGGVAGYIAGNGFKCEYGVVDFNDIKDVFETAKEADPTT